MKIDVRRNSIYPAVLAPCKICGTDRYVHTVLCDGMTMVRCLNCISGVYPERARATADTLAKALEKWNAMNALTTIEEVVKLAKDIDGRIDEILDEMVHDAADEIAAAANNNGIEGQVEFLEKEGWSQKHILDEILRISRGDKE